MRLSRILYAALFASAAMPAFMPEPAHAQDVVMRRPLPGSSTSDPSSCTVLGNCPTPTPTPTCTDPFLCPVQPPPVDPGINKVYSWRVGAWQGATVSCGQQANLTRDVTCMSSTIIQSNGVSTTLPLIEDDAGPGACVAAVGPMPAATYAGTKSNCNPTPQITGWTPWTAPSGEDAQCSALATRTALYKCVMGGQDVDMAYCLGDPTPGAPGFTPQVQTGNDSGCTAEWKDQVTDLGCQSAEHNERHEAVCKRGETVLTGTDEAACDIGKEPFPRVRTVQVGTCSYQWINFSPNSYAGDGNPANGSGGNSSPYHCSGTVVSEENGFVDVNDPNGACGSNVTCCQYGSYFYHKGIEQGFWVIGTNGSVVSDPGSCHTPEEPDFCVAIGSDNGAYIATGSSDTRAWVPDN